MNKNTIPFWAQLSLNFTLKKNKNQGRNNGGKFRFRQKKVTVTKTQSWFRLPLPKPGFGHTLIHRYRISFGNKFDKNKQDKKNKTDK